MIKHPIRPLYDENSEILILGSFPSVKSREQLFFYGHPQNRFWRVVAEIFGSEVPESIEEKKELLINNRVALWDVIARCDIVGSADTSIKNVVPNNIKPLLQNSKIKRIFVNGKSAEKYYNIYLRDDVGISAIYLSSTSPANAAWSIDRLIEEWKQIKTIQNF